MAVLVPETATRLQATAFVHGAALMTVGRVEIIREAAEQMAEGALRKLLADCIKTKGDYMGHQGQTLCLDVYLLTPEDLHAMLVEARAQGERDAMRWGIEPPNWP